jgi:hypothetical protein
MVVVDNCDNHIVVSEDEVQFSRRPITILRSGHEVQYKILFILCDERNVGT